MREKCSILKVVIWSSTIIQTNAFAEDQLLNLIKVGLEKSTQIKESLLTLESAKNSKYISYAKLLPTLSLTRGRTYSKSKDYDSTTKQQVWSNTQSDTLTLSSNWTIWDNFANINTIRTATIENQGQVIKSMATLNEYTLSLSEKFFEYQENLSKKESVEILLQQSKKAYDEARLQEELGRKTKFEVMDAEIDVMNAEKDLSEILIVSKNIRRDLVKLLNLEKEEDLELKKEDMTEYTPFFFEQFKADYPSIKEHWKKTIDQVNPQINLTKLDIEKSSIEMFSNKLSLLPTLSITASNSYDYGYKVSQNVEYYRTKPKNDLSLSISLSWTIWDFFQTPLTYANSKKQFEINRLKYREEENNSKAELESLIDQYEINQKTINTAKLVLEKSIKLFEYNSTMYQLGKITLFARQNSMNKLYDAKQNYAEKLKGQYVLAVKILNKMGRSVL